MPNVQTAETSGRAREQLRANVERGVSPSFAEQEAAWLNVFGDWKAFVRFGNRQDEIPVRPLASADLAALREAIAGVVANREQQVIGELDGQTNNHPDDVLLRAEAARQASNDTQTAVAGEVQLLNQFYNALFSGVASRTPDIFVVAPENVAAYLVSRHQTELKGAQVSNTPLETDPASEGVERCFVVAPHKGEAIAAIFKNNGHEVKTLHTADGFQVRFGGLRLAFFYSARHRPANAEAWRMEKEKKSATHRSALPN